MELESRRSFNQKMLGSLLAYGLVETVFSCGLLADSVRPVVHQWMAGLNDLCRDLKGRKMKDVEFQDQLEALYRKVDLAELCMLLDLDRLAATVKYPDKGAASLGMDLRKVEGLPARLAFG